MKKKKKKKSTNVTPNYLSLTNCFKRESVYWDEKKDKFDTTEPYAHKEVLELAKSNSRSPSRMNAESRINLGNESYLSPNKGLSMKMP